LKVGHWAPSITPAEFGISLSWTFCSMPGIPVQHVFERWTTRNTWPG
jgi:hypothetical protein